MRVAKTVAGVALAMAAAGTASAAEPHEASGRIEHLNPKRHHLTIGHQIYRYDPRLIGTELRRGERVRVLYRERHGHRYAVQILPAA